MDVWELLDVCSSKHKQTMNDHLLLFSFFPSILLPLREPPSCTSVTWWKTTKCKWTTWQYGPNYLHLPYYTFTVNYFLYPNWFIYKFLHHHQWFRKTITASKTPASHQMSMGCDGRLKGHVDGAPPKLNMEPDMRGVGFQTLMNFCTSNPCNVKSTDLVNKKTTCLESCWIWNKHIVPKFYF